MSITSAEEEQGDGRGERPLFFVDAFFVGGSALAQVHQWKTYPTSEARQQGAFCPLKSVHKSRYLEIIEGAIPCFVIFQ